MAIGFLNLDKPAGLTSHDCVRQVRRAFNLRRVGHGGTLDPAATGVLPVAIGRATRFLQYLPAQKRYRATFQLGRESNTDDAEGEIVRITSAAGIQESDVRRALLQFSGTIAQVPPLYSAVRKQGKRLYELARAGVRAEELDIQPRTVEIHRIELLTWRAGDVAELDVDILCGAGTYIRAIARDLGRTLGCGGLMSALRRSQSGAFTEASSIPLDTFLACERPESFLQSVKKALADFPIVRLDDETAKRWCCGQVIARTDLNAEDLQVNLQSGSEGVLVRTLDPVDTFLGLGRLEGDRFVPERVLASQN
ncbi:MAG: tRNA pseudouridine(55) synthase TruB [Cyanobacteria bacterium P01_D01_bin.123]